MAVEEGLQYSVAQLREIKKEKGYDLQPGRVRPMPNEVTMLVEFLEPHHRSTLELIDYLRGAFYVYRACVNQNYAAGIPLVNCSGVYEWPKSTEVDWIDIDKVSLVGQMISGPEDKPKRVVRNPDLAIDRAIVGMENSLIFGIPSLDRLGFLQDGVEWQSELLKIINPLAQVRRYLLEKKITEIDARVQILKVVKAASKIRDENLEVMKT